MKNAWAVTLSKNNSVIHWLECRFIQISIYCLLKYSLFIKSPSILSVHLIVIIMVSSTLMRKVPQFCTFSIVHFRLTQQTRGAIFPPIIFFFYIYSCKQNSLHSVSKFLKKEKFQNLKIVTKN